jgi:hypothetical protein
MVFFITITIATMTTLFDFRTTFSGLIFTLLFTTNITPIIPNITTAEPALFGVLSFLILRTGHP